MSGFLFENAATRASLKSAFDQLFCKYGREFDDDDEIDLTDLSIVNVGGHVVRERARGFGSCYRKSSKRMESEAAAAQDQPTPAIEEQEDNYDDVFKRISGNVKAAHMRARFEPLTFSPLPPLRRTESKRSIGSPRTKTVSRLREMTISDSLSESEEATETEKNGVSSDDDSLVSFGNRSHSFDDHLFAIITCEQRPGNQNISNRACSCYNPACFDCHLLRICEL